MDNSLPYLNNELSFEERAKDLVSRMTLDEKVSQMLYSAPAVERLGIPSYNWWNEGLHGIARAGVATVFPQAIGLAASFNTELLGKVAEVISTEGRSKYHEFQRKGDHDIYKGLTIWSPNVNIFRDPRWGRGHETYGEDPYLTAELGKAFVRGLQGNDKKFLKTAACAKHYAVHSGPEGERHSFNAVASQKDMRETYLYAFRELVKEAGVEGVMGAYNRTNGEPCCGSKTLLKDILRREWGFKGYVTSDCWAIKDFHVNHRVTKNAIESVAMAVNNGCDTNCGSMFANLLIAIQEGLVTEDAINNAVEHLMVTRMKLGLFAKSGEDPYANIPYEENDSPEHKKFNLETAKKTLVLLKNENNTLPLNKSKIKSIAVIGPNANSRSALIGNYHGTASRYYTVLDGIEDAVGDGVRVYYADGCHLWKSKTEELALEGDRLAEAVSAAERSDAVILCLGLDETLEGEEGDESNTFNSGDKTQLELPGLQQELMEKIAATGKPVILVLLAGSALAVTWAQEHVPAIIQAWYPGAEGGKAVASLIFGEYSPSGRLPVTFYNSTEDLPDFHDYSMENRTYRYFMKKPLYPFGYGLSYTTFEYSKLTLSSKVIAIGENLSCTITVENVGKMEGDEIVQLYLQDLKASVRVPIWQLQGIKAIHLKPNERTEVTFELTPRQFSLIDNDGNRVFEPGFFRVFVGPSQPDERSIELSGQKPLSEDFEVQGQSIQFEY
ncbi:MAG TPA: glycoside hydrolase family 3 C-terminal domain-containing protein [Ruminiclostridium sp.]|nr:glycoside hydrolase family 3 C-terminal domain-containing protein [Ruminiclostridium sp.]